MAQLCSNSLSTVAALWKGIPDGEYVWAIPDTGRVIASIVCPKRRRHEKGGSKEKTMQVLSASQQPCGQTGQAKGRRASGLSCMPVDDTTCRGGSSGRTLLSINPSSCRDT
eukprot:EG_transcript_54148